MNSNDLTLVVVCAADSCKPRAPHSFFSQSCSSHRAALPTVVLSFWFRPRGTKKRTPGNYSRRVSSFPSLLPEGYAAFRQIVMRHLYHNFVTWQDPNEMQSHFSGDVGQNPMSIGQFPPKHRIRQQLDYPAFNFDDVFSRHVKISGSPLVTRTVCSKCADGEWSSVTTVQSSCKTFTAARPMLTIGSI